MTITGYNLREGSQMLADRIAERDEQASAARFLARSGDPLQELAPDDEYAIGSDVCACGETLYRGRCYNVGECRHAERSAVRQSLARGTAASARPAAWNLGGRVD